ncbi:glycosyltransferase [Roseomonas soli]|uniref:Glycosyltransferase n=1 Tax=Neoroseomonas soli TaxID=1081025 RepID=A0A9X9X4L7_9PROT|nr:glycosyltransferase [Neoroseomonas soli]
MPTYNGEHWIADALNSIASGGDSDGIECIIIDSSKSSATLDIVSSFSDRLQLYAMQRLDLPTWQQKTNLGLDLASADYVCTLHQDDKWLPGRSSDVRRWISEAPHVALHLSPAIIIGSKGEKLGVWRCPFPIGMVSNETFIPNIIVQNFVAMPAPVFRRDLALAAGGVDEDLGYTGDWDLWIKLGLLGEVWYHEFPVSAFRVHAASLTVSSARSPDYFEAQQRTVLQRHMEHVPLASRVKVLRAAEASIAVNVALASAANGMPQLIPRALCRLLSLGPLGIWRFLSTSRLTERVMPRIRAKLSGAL